VPAAGNSVDSSVGAGTRLVLVRHAESVGNATGVIAGHEGCAGLSELGVRQAEALRSRLAATGELDGTAAVYTSLMRRAAQTAEILMPALGDAPLTRTCDVCEQHPGEADGMTWLDYARTYGFYSRRRTPTLPLAPGGEAWTDFRDRAAAALLAIVARHGGELVVVVSHGGVVDASLVHLLDLPDHGIGVSLRTWNASLTEWSHTGRRWVLERYNDRAHLLGDPSLRGASPVAVANEALAEAAAAGVLTEVPASDL
jgi:probable phosphoglycerate mutase